MSNEAKISSESTLDLERRTGGRLYGRTLRVTVGLSGEQGRSWTGLKVSVNVVRTSRKKPNKAKIQIYNLSKESEAFIQRAGALVTVEAGYAGETGIVFTGTIDEVELKRDGGGVDRVAEIIAADARVEFQRAKIFETFDGAIPAPELLRRLATAAGLRLAPLPVFEGIDYPNGYTGAGAFKDVFSSVAEENGLAWSFQNGEVVVVVVGGTTREEAVVVSTASGNLVGSPTKKKKTVTFKALASAQFAPSRLVRLESEEFTGFYSPTKVTFDLNSLDGDFYATIEATEV